MRCLLGVDLQYLGFDLLPDGEHIGGSVDATPGDVGHVQQAIDAADIDERAVVHQVANRAGDDFAFLDLGITQFLCGAIFFFEHDAPIDDHVLLGDIQLGDAAADLLVHQLWHLGGIAHSTARRGMKARTPTSTLKPPFTMPVTVPMMVGLLGKGTLQPLQSFGRATWSG